MLSVLLADARAAFDADDYKQAKHELEKFVEQTKKLHADGSRSRARSCSSGPRTSTRPTFPPRLGPARHPRRARPSPFRPAVTSGRNGGTSSVIAHCFVELGRARRLGHPAVVGFKRLFGDTGSKGSHLSIAESDSAIGNAADPGRSLRHIKLAAQYLLGLRAGSKAQPQSSAEEETVHESDLQEVAG